MSARLIDFDEFENLTTSILKNGQMVRFTAHGSSMHPFIQDGDVVEVHQTKPDGLIPGDVVLARLFDGRLVVHRVIRIFADNILIQGDSLICPDGMIHLSNVLGQVDVISRQGKRIPFDSLNMKSFSRFLLIKQLSRNLFHRVTQRIRRTISALK